MNTIKLTKESADHGQAYWVTSIKKDKSEVRDHIKFVYVKDNTITSTDGSRLHHAKLDGDYPEGLYDVIKRTKSLIVMFNKVDYDIQYPDFADIIKPPSPATEIPACIDRSHKDFASVTRVMDKETALNFHFFEDAINCDDMFIASIGENGTPVILESENKVAAVMPIRID